MDNKGDLYTTPLSNKPVINTQKVKRKLITLAFDTLGFGLSMVLVFMGYSYGKEASDRLLIASQAKDFDKVPIKIGFPSSTPEATPSSLCPSDFQQFITSSFTICLPSRFSQQNTIENEYHYVSSNEEFTVRVGKSEPIPLDLCNVEKEVSVQTYSATQTVFKNETAGGCGEIYGFTTRIHASNGEVQLYLINKGGVYDDAHIFEVIEQSLTVL